MTPGESTVEFTLVEDDLVAFSKNYLRGNRLVRQLVVLYWLLPMLALLLAIGIGLRAAGTQMTLWQGIGIMSVVYLGYSVIQSVRTQPQRMVRGLRKMGHNRLQLSAQALTINSNGVCWRGLTGERLYRWFAIWRIDATSSHAFIYTDWAHAFIVPARVFNSNGDFDSFVKLAQQYRDESPAYGLVCPKCKYALDPDADPGCPECGWKRSAIPARSSTSD